MFGEVKKMPFTLAELNISGNGHCLFKKNLQQNLPPGIYRSYLQKMLR